MNAPRYSVCLEVSGPLAMFARPDTGAAPTSYPAPTWSAAKGILESIAFFSDGDAWLNPTRVEICRRRDAPGGAVTYQRYATNYGGPLRKPTNIRNGTGMQVFATVLSNVCYRLHAEIVGPRGAPGRNPRHHLQDLFERRLTQGRCHRTPALGWSEFTCDYWGPPRPEETVVDEGLTLDVPSMLLSVWDRETSGGYASRFAQDVRIERGRLVYQSPQDAGSPC